MKDENWWWIDYIEGELDPTTHPDIEFLLEKSLDDREEFESWRLLKTWIKEVDPVGKEEKWSQAELLKLKENTLKKIELEGGAQDFQIEIRTL